MWLSWGGNPGMAVLKLLNKTSIILPSGKPRTAAVREWKGGAQVVEIEATDSRGK
jgi:hypothetical protein